MIVASGHASLMAVVAATTAALAFLMETILDDVFTARDRSSLYMAAAVVMAVFLLKGAATYGQNVLVSFVGQRILADLQKRMFDHLLRQGFAGCVRGIQDALLTRLCRAVAGANPGSRYPGDRYHD